MQRARLTDREEVMTTVITTTPADLRRLDLFGAYLQDRNLYDEGQFNDDETLKIELATAQRIGLLKAMEHVVTVKSIHEPYCDFHGACNRCKSGESVPLHRVTAEQLQACANGDVVNESGIDIIIRTMAIFGYHDYDPGNTTPRLIEEHKAIKEQVIRRK
jgi:hypothetical protein